MARTQTFIHTKGSSIMREYFSFVMDLAVSKILHSLSEWVAKISKFMKSVFDCSDQWAIVELSKETLNNLKKEA